MFQKIYLEFFTDLSKIFQLESDYVIRSRSRSRSRGQYTLKSLVHDTKVKQNISVFLGLKHSSTFPSIFVTLTCLNPQ